MSHVPVRGIILAVCLAVVSGPTVMAQDGSAIKLPAAQKTGGMPLMEALDKRASAREFDTRELPPQILSNLLWAAFGINRPDGRRTAPTAMNRLEYEVYAALPAGLYRYDAANHALELVVKKDIRALTGSQAFCATAPLNLIYVADYTKLGNTPDDGKDASAGIDVGFIGQNVYLYCASAGLANVIRAMVDKPALEKAMGLPATKHVVLCHTVGYPK